MADDSAVAAYTVEADPWEELAGPAFEAFIDDVEAALRDEATALPAEELSLGLTGARRSLNRAGLSGREVVQVLDDQLVGAIESVGRLQTQLEAIGFTLAREAAGRGLHTEVGMSLVDWLRVRCPWMSAEVASRITAVITIAATPTGSILGDAVARATVPVHRAATVARTLLRLESSLDPDQREAYTQVATDAAALPDLSDRDLSVVCHRLVEDLLQESQPGERERAAIQLRTVSQRTVAPGLTRFTIDAPDGDAATLGGILTSRLSAPTPGEDDEPDPRTPGQRRFDALMSVVDRGLSRPGETPSTARAAIILTIPFDPATGRPSGPATTSTGGYVSPRQAAELACTSDITPVWLSPQGEPLSLGRTARYATPGQWKALAARDRGCTFPGCSSPPQWCDSHHLDGWARGGHTDVDRMTLLCGRHHTLVHLHQMTAVVSGGTVRWHV